MQTSKTNSVLSGEINTLRPLMSQLYKQLGINTAVVITDPNTQRFCYPLIRDIIADLGKNVIYSLPDGEQHKTLDQLTELFNFLLLKSAGRHTLLVNLGGGMLCDLGGFAASIYKRGVPCLNIPTTLLAQVDAAVGGKTGINYRNIKNLLGTFTQPAAVFIHPGFLSTLPAEQWRSGLGELFKYCLISGWMELSALTQLNRDSTDELLPLIEEAVRFKEEITTIDPFDHGIRRVLNYGHTIGHALEAAALEEGLPLLHGEAVAAGIVAETWLSVHLANLNPQLLDAVTEVYRTHFATVTLPLDDPRKLIPFLQQDKKNRDSATIQPVLLKERGTPIFDITASEADILDAIRYLKHIVQ